MPTKDMASLGHPIGILCESEDSAASPPDEPDCQPCQPQERPEIDDVPPDDARILTPDQLAAAAQIPAADLHRLFSALDGENRKTFQTLSAQLARRGLTPTTAGRLALAQLAAGNGDGKGG